MSAQQQLPDGRTWQWICRDYTSQSFSDVQRHQTFKHINQNDQYAAAILASRLALARRLQEEEDDDDDEEEEEEEEVQSPGMPSLSRLPSALYATARGPHLALLRAVVPVPMPVDMEVPDGDDLVPVGDDFVPEEQGEEGAAAQKRDRQCGG